MTSGTWIVDKIGIDRIRAAKREAARRQHHGTLAATEPARIDDHRIRCIANLLELQAFDLLDSANTGDLRTVASEAFHVARVLPRPEWRIEARAVLVRLGCLGVLGDRSADVKRLLTTEYPELPIQANEWGQCVWSSVLDAWLRLLRGQGRSDLDETLARVATIRSEQSQLEPRFCSKPSKGKISHASGISLARTAWRGQPRRSRPTRRKNR